MILLNRASLYKKKFLQNCILALNFKMRKLFNPSYIQQELIFPHVFKLNSTHKVFIFIFYEL